MAEEEIILPMQKVKASTMSPKNLIIFSPPKVGKTELLANLPNNLILDMEDGSDFVDAIKMKAKSVGDIKKIGAAIKKANYPYDYVTVDTITALETICIPYAELLYARTPMVKNWFKKDKDGNLDKVSGKKQYGEITSLPNGGGYAYLRQAFTNIIEHIKTFAPRIILLGHVKD
ncbi:AAA family ATPase, partial [bacterium]|nr:AAA family ATPase [bacterium]